MKFYFTFVALFMIATIAVVLINTPVAFGYYFAGFAIALLVAVIWGLNDLRKMRVTPGMLPLSRALRY